MLHVPEANASLQDASCSRNHTWHAPSPRPLHAITQAKAAYGRPLECDRGSHCPTHTMTLAVGPRAPTKSTSVMLHVGRISKSQQNITPRKLHQSGGCVSDDQQRSPACLSLHISGQQPSPWYRATTHEKVLFTTCDSGKGCWRLRHDGMPSSLGDGKRESCKRSCDLTCESRVQPRGHPRLGGI